MNTMTGWIDYWNHAVKKFTIWDVKLAQMWAAAWILVLVKIFPQIVQISVWWFVLIAAVCGPRLFFVVFSKKNT